MIWSFVWRFVLFAYGLTWASTFVVGFVVKMAGGTMETTHSIGTVVQGVAIVLAAASAYLNAKDAQKT